MNRKEHKGGLRTNEEIEQELQRTGADQTKGRSYRGSQDTGDEIVREKGTDIQQQDGIGDNAGSDAED